MLLAAQEDPELQQILENAALVTPESSGILWASKALGAPLQEFTPGIDLMLSVCRVAEIDERTVFLLGSEPGVAEAASKALQRQFPRLRIAGTEQGYFKASEEFKVISLIRSVSPDLLFVGMGMPAQEKWIAKHLLELRVSVVMGVGGSFDVLSGKLMRAPAPMRRLGIEWVYRLAQEPWRWRRISQLPMFVIKVLKQKWSQRVV